MDLKSAQRKIQKITGQTDIDITKCVCVYSCDWTDIVCAMQDMFKIFNKNRDKQVFVLVVK